ncbi:pyridine nucleotide-disulfide oxidoreductase-domain-containing protein [Blastocladiella britannica]|nr:pyridine nucleotide-disulfide oxidoreductase-domain-containing protein [Blastocladiella britannica]
MIPGAFPRSLARLSTAAIARIPRRAFASVPPTAAGSKASHRWKWAAYLVAGTGAVSAFVAYRTNPWDQQDPDPTKKTLVVLGTGWGAVSLLQRIDTSEYNTVVVSPRNFFLFTPLLPSVTTGSLESRSVITPVKYFTRFKPVGATFYEAEATDIDPASKTIEIVDTSEIKGTVTKTRIPYDYLVLAVGAESQTFGIPGVKEHGLFLKELSDARKIRTRLMDVIETAGFPGQPEEEINRLLHMVVVGGGPTGVEYAGELYDFVNAEIKKWYPEVASKVHVTLIEAMPHVLPMFSRDMIDYTEQSFKDMNIALLNNTAVKEVRERELIVADKEGNKTTIPYGLLCWATGNTMRPLIKGFVPKIKEQTNRRGLLVDDYLRLEGAKDIWALGDCTASRYAPTAQVAAQQGIYLARQLNDLALSERTGNDIAATTPSFTYSHRATLAYIGGERGVSDVELPIIGKMISVSGYQSYLFWRSAYLSNLFTMRNKVLVAFDWTKEKLFGRDISRE